MMMGKNNGRDLPPGFRFHPTDEELIMHYLKNHGTSQPYPDSIIPQVDIYKFDPWHLPDQAGFGEKEWYFFTPRDRKYPNGARPNRAAVSGYWKATGTDKDIYSGSKYVGVKKALVFYIGKPPKGIKTDWIMHEYRLVDGSGHASPPKLVKNKSMRLDEWVLCRIYNKKKKKTLSMEPVNGMIKLEDTSGVQAMDYNDNNTLDPPEPAPEDMKFQFPRVSSISHMLDWERELNFLNDSSDRSSSAYDSIFNNGYGSQWNIEPAYYMPPPQDISQTNQLFGFL